MIEKTFRVSGEDGAVISNSAVLWTTTAGEISPDGILKIDRDTYAKGGTVTATIPSYGKKIDFAFGLSPEDYAEGLTIVDADGITVVPTEITDKKLYVLYAKTSDGRILSNEDVVWTTNYFVPVIDGTLMVDGTEKPGQYLISCYARTNPASSASVSFTIPEITSITLVNGSGDAYPTSVDTAIPISEPTHLDIFAKDNFNRIVPLDNLIFGSNYTDLEDGLFTVIPDAAHTGTFTVKVYLKSNPAVTAATYFKIGDNSGLVVSGADGTAIPSSGIVVPRNHDNRDTSVSFVVKYNGIETTNVVWTDTYNKTKWNDNTITFVTSEPQVSGILTCRIPNTSISVEIPCSYEVQGLQDPYGFNGGVGVYVADGASSTAIRFTVIDQADYNSGDNISIISQIDGKNYVTPEIVGYFTLQSAKFIGVTRSNIIFDTNTGEVSENRFIYKTNSFNNNIGVRARLVDLNTNVGNANFEVTIHILHPSSFTYDDSGKIFTINWGNATVPDNVIFVSSNENEEILFRNGQMIKIKTDASIPLIRIISTIGNYIMCAEFNATNNTFIDYLA